MVEVAGEGSEKIANENHHGDATVDSATEPDDGLSDSGSDSDMSDLSVDDCAARERRLLEGNRPESTSSRDSADERPEEAEEQASDSASRQRRLLRMPRSVFAANTHEWLAQGHSAPRWPHGFRNLIYPGPQPWPSEPAHREPFWTRDSSLPPVPRPAVGGTGCSKTRSKVTKSNAAGLAVVVYDASDDVCARQRYFDGRSYSPDRCDGDNSNTLPAPWYTLQSPSDTTVVFEARFESGNLLRAVKIPDGSGIDVDAYELELRNDLYTQRHTQWYYFRAANLRRGRRYRFTIVNCMKKESLYNDGMRPLVLSETHQNLTGETWRRGGEEIAYYGVSGTRYYALTWTYTGEHEHDACLFAHCYPYTYTMLEQSLRTMVGNPALEGFVRHRIMCKTLAGNNCHLLTITNFTNDPEVLRLRKGIVVTGRMHPGETQGSWMMEGFLEFITGDSREAQWLREHAVLKVVPMLNVDGVVCGNYRCSLDARDLNRVWNRASKSLHPSVYYTREMIRRLKGDRPVAAFVDLHGHSRKNNAFIYGCPAREGAQRFSEQLFPRLVHICEPDKFNLEGCTYQAQASKASTARVVVFNEFGVDHSFTLEATFSGSTLGSEQGLHFSREGFGAIGHAVGNALFRFVTNEVEGVNARKEALRAAERQARVRIAALINNRAKRLTRQRSFPSAYAPTTASAATSNGTTPPPPSSSPPPPVVHEASWSSLPSPTNTTPTTTLFPCDTHHLPTSEHLTTTTTTTTFLQQRAPSSASSIALASRKTTKGRSSAGRASTTSRKIKWPSESSCVVDPDSIDLDAVYAKYSRQLNCDDGGSDSSLSEDEWNKQRRQRRQLALKRRKERNAIRERAKSAIVSAKKQRQQLQQQQQEQQSTPPVVVSPPTQLQSVTAKIDSRNTAYTRAEDQFSLPPVTHSPRDIHDKARASYTPHNNYGISKGSKHTPLPPKSSRLPHDQSPSHSRSVSHTPPSVSQATALPPLLPPPTTTTASRSTTSARTPVSLGLCVLGSSAQYSHKH